MSDSSIPVTAVFDIGKTNKKFILFDKNYEIVLQEQTTIDQIKDEDGFPSEDLNSLIMWIEFQLSKVLHGNEFQVDDLNFSTFGATLVNVDDKGKVVTPVYDYLKPYPDKLREAFYEKYGGVEKFSLETASPPLGMLNSGLQIYWLKNERPEFFEKISYSLHFPQYLSYRFTGSFNSELTSVGCHTTLWDFNRGEYHRWVREERVETLLPDLVPLSEKKRVKYSEKHIFVGVGIHDSSASLAPYLIAMDDPFLLLSTGTWSITFNPFSRDAFTFEELQRDCLCYIDIYGNQVKASRVFLGNEYRHQKERLTKHFGVTDTEAHEVLDPKLLQRLIENATSEQKLKLEKAHSSGPFPTDEPETWNLNQFSSYKEAYHQLMMDLVCIQHECMKLTDMSENIDQAIVTGGFGKNKFFLKLLATRLSEKSIYSADMPHATALGAALVIADQSQQSSYNLKPLLNLTLHKPVTHTDFSSYSWK